MVALDNNIYLLSLRLWMEIWRMWLHNAFLIFEEKNRVAYELNCHFLKNLSLIGIFGLVFILNIVFQFCSSLFLEESSSSPWLTHPTSSSDQLEHIVDCESFCKTISQDNVGNWEICTITETLITNDISKETRSSKIINFILIDYGVNLFAIKCNTTEQQLNHPILDLWE